TAMTAVSAQLERPCSAADPVPPVIDRPYLLVTHIPCFRLADGRRAVGELWHKDLVEHLRYLPSLTLAAPLATGPIPTGLLALPGEEEGLHHVDLPHRRSLIGAVLGLPALTLRLWKAVGRAQIVHTGVTGWPIPVGWIATAIGRLRRRFLVTVIESSDWR